MIAFGKSPRRPIEPKTTITMGATARIGTICEQMIHGSRLFCRLLMWTINIARTMPKLAPSKVRLVDPDAQRKEVAENDPGKKIREGSSIKDAVAHGFAHGLVTLGEIRFDKDHAYAVVWYGFTCGALCGNGATVILEKKNGKWGVRDHCSNWVS